ncbi:26S proteasome non-ATPase regulatory subunit 12 [Irineochytrium annulatum]|nr:26S proteasome non-ATPase regulatory subunit 12 [Irineochytrium annulatum]
MNEPKMIQDLSAVVDVQIPEAEKLAKAGSLTEAVDLLMATEKQTRTSADGASNTRILLAIIRLSFEAKDFKGLGERITLLSKKHGLLKASVTRMIQEAMTYIDKTPSKEVKLELIDTLRTVTDGKIFVEVERARLTRTLSKIKEEEGNITEAADVLHDLQVETFGSMDKREKTDFILEQMRLCMAKKDYVRVQIISRRISTKLFEKEENDDLKLRFYNLMIEYSLHESQYLNTCKYFRQLHDTKAIKDDEKRSFETLRDSILYVVLAPYDNEQSDLIHRIYEDPNISKQGLFKEFAKCFITNELVRWPKIEEIYGAALKSTPAFNVSTEGGQARLKALHQRVIEHNIRVVAKYYTRISMKRLTQLLDLPDKEAEEFLSKLVVSKTIYAKIDRPSGVVSFIPRKDPNTILNDWSRNINSLLDLINKTWHFPLPGQSSKAHQILASITGQPMFNTLSFGLTPASATKMDIPSGMPGAPAASIARQARRLYVGSIPFGITEVLAVATPERSNTFQEVLIAFFNETMVQLKMADAKNLPIIAAQINHDKNYAFIEFRTPEESSAAMALDGLPYQGQQLKIRRPKDYQAPAGTAGTIASVSMADSPNKLFIGGLPSYLNDEQVMELLKSFGELRAFNLVKDTTTGLSKGYAFCEYANPAVTDIAVQGLNGMDLGDKKLIVQRASIGANKVAATTYVPAILPNTLVNLGPTNTDPTPILMLLNMVTADELHDDDEYRDILEDIREECSKFGEIESLLIPRPKTGVDNPHVGKIYVAFKETESCTKALKALAGRKFADRTVFTSYLTVEEYQALQEAFGP